MILERLRAETKEGHQTLEKAIIPRIKNARNTEDYIRLLEIFYGYFKPVEEMIAQHINNNNLPDHAQRRKSGAILEDIRKSGGDIAHMRVSDDIPQINNDYQAMGAMYVLEGSTLGGQVISNMLKQNLQLKDTSTISFFSGYGKDTGTMWAAFTEKLDNYTSDPQKQDEIAAAANETFSKFKSWVEKQEVTV